MDDVVKVLEDEDSGFFPVDEIQYLVDKSLVEISLDNSKLKMHHAIREMGEEVVRQENEDEPGLRTRLVERWFDGSRSNVIRMLRECSGTESLETIHFYNRSLEDPNMQKEALKKMRNLRLINLKANDRCWNGLTSEHEYGFMTPLCFRKLRYMDWQYFPFRSLNTFDMENVVVLRLRFSNLEILWEGIKSLKKLRILDMSMSSSLTKTGDFYGLENLEELDLSYCANLKELDISISRLHKLAFLDISGCSVLMDCILNCKMIGKLPSLRQLGLGPFHLEPDHHMAVDTFLSLQKSLLQLHQLKIIKFLDTDYLQRLPPLPGYFPSLPRNITSISIFFWRSLMKLPGNLSEFKSLRVLQLVSCPELVTNDPQFFTKVTGLTNLHDLKIRNCYVSQVPTEIKNMLSLKTLDLSLNPFSSLPDSLSNLLQLDSLNIQRCNELRLLPRLPPNLRTVLADWCLSLDVMPFEMSYIFHTKVSPFGEPLKIHLKSVGDREFPEWCSCRLGGGILSFVAPMMQFDKKICGMILCANPTYMFYGGMSPLKLKMLNKTKNTSHSLNIIDKVELMSMAIIFYPLDHTTVVVEPGDTVVLEFYPKKSVVWRCGLRLIYENEVVYQNYISDDLHGYDSDGDSDSDHSYMD